MNPNAKGEKEVLMDPALNDMTSFRGSEFRLGWTVIVSAAVGVGLGITGLPIYTTGQFIMPLGAAFGWSREAAAGGLIFLTIGSVLMAPIMARDRPFRRAPDCDDGPAWALPWLFWANAE